MYVLNVIVALLLGVGFLMLGVGKIIGVKIMTEARQHLGLPSGLFKVIGGLEILGGAGCAGWSARRPADHRNSGSGWLGGYDDWRRVVSPKGGRWHEGMAPRCDDGVDGDLLCHPANSDGVSDKFSS